MAQQPPISKEDFFERPAHLPIVLDNRTCVYCGVELTPEITTKEHVIGRRFAPKGKLDGWWNLIVRACDSCNRIKRELEDDISAITLGPDASGRLATDDPLHRAEALRKGRHSFSRRTKKLVAESVEKLNITASFFGGVLTTEFVSPPQIELDRIFHLARLQVRAFFYFLTYDEPKKVGKFWQEGCYYVEHVNRADWGNPLLRGFADAVKDWEPRLIAVGADGFFKVAIRRHPTEGCFSWALEWNQNYRIIGFFGDKRLAQQIVNSLPPLEMVSIGEKENGDYVRYRAEVPLRDEDDTLFDWPDSMPLHGKPK